MNMRLMFWDETNKGLFIVGHLLMTHEVEEKNTIKEPRKD